MASLEKRIKKLKRSWKRLPDKWQSAYARVRAISSKSDKHRIAFQIAGGMGDHILAARFVRDVTHAAGDIEFDVFCSRPGIAKWIFSDISGCRLIADRKSNIKILRHEYVGIINAQTFADVIWENKSETQDRIHTTIKNILANIRISASDIQLVIKHHPHLDGYLGHYASLKGYRRHNYLHAAAGIVYGGDKLNLPYDNKIFSRLGLDATEQYITISNGYDEEAHSEKGKPATKVYPYFCEIIKSIKQKYPSIKLVQIGTDTSTPISGIDINLINMTSLQEASALIKNARLHIDNEGGLVHLAAALGTPSAVIFGPTLATYFGYESNLNIAPVVCGGCWWMERTWMTKCVRNEEKPPCMYMQSPIDVAKKICDFISAHEEEVRQSKLANLKSASF
ncbi:MAG: glycosyltransferase family 9 protein [Acidobacteriota bacterium]